MTRESACGVFLCSFIIVATCVLLRCKVTKLKSKHKAAWYNKRNLVPVLPYWLYGRAGRVT